MAHKQNTDNTDVEGGPVQGGPTGGHLDRNRPDNNHPEQRRLKAHRERRANWKLWGPYLSERAWGTVREDYSRDGEAWDYFTHEDAQSRAYRWNEDGLAGFCDRNQYLCFALALWNGKDPCLKERLFGLSGPEGNHGEDVKELYWYEDSTPTHSYARMRYRYPQAAFPYAQLRSENAQRGYSDREYEITDTGVFDDNRYFDMQVSYAKSAEEDILISVCITNHSAHSEQCHVIPQLWFRNTWSWGYEHGPMGDQTAMPVIRQVSHEDTHDTLHASHPVLGDYHLHWQYSPEVLFTENNSNCKKLFGTDNLSTCVKDAFHEYIVGGTQAAINSECSGTKAGLHYTLKLAAKASRTLQFRLSNKRHTHPFRGFKPIFERRLKEADTFYRAIAPQPAPPALKDVQRQALAGMLWSKQLYYYDVWQWLTGDPLNRPQREHNRNSQWQHMHNFDVVSMPDKWEYPWYAVWDSAFHTLPLAMTDPDYAKRQLTLFTREWYMHPNGQLPAYEWAFGDVNPPVHAWATWQVYQMASPHHNTTSKPAERRDNRVFLEGIFQKLLLNFNWWVNRKDAQGHSIFEGGFLGMDNISIFDRSEEPPTGGVLRQSDATGWMGFYAQCMLHMSLELARDNPIYEDTASKFMEHYLQIASAINGTQTQAGLWHDDDGFFYDRLDLPDHTSVPIQVRSLVGLIPLIAVTVIDDEMFTAFPDFTRRMRWVLQHRPHLAAAVNNPETPGHKNRHLISFLDEDKLRQVLAYLLDENEFLSDFGIRSLSRYHQRHPFSYHTADGDTLTVGYEPGEGESDMFGGNSNWRGPIWFPINYLIVEALRKYHQYYGDTFTIECPTGSGKMMTLDAVADDISRRLIRIFEPDSQGQHPWCGDNTAFIDSSNDQSLHLFFEYFNGDTGEGVGASHQTGWTGLIALLIEQQYGRSD